MKNLTILVVSGVLLSLVLIGGSMLVFPTQTPEHPAIVVRVNPTVTALEQTLAEQESAYQSELSILEKNLEQQETAYQAQVDALARKIEAAERELARLKSQEEALVNQLEQLKTERAKKLKSYQDSLEQVRADYLARQEELQARLTELETELSAVNAQLKQ